MADCLSLIQSNLETLKTYEKNILSNEGSISDVLKKVKDIYINYSLKTQERGIKILNYFENFYFVVIVLIKYFYRRVLIKVGKLQNAFDCDLTC